MEKTKEEKEMFGTSWPLLFLVTGCSLIGFSFIMIFLEGKQSKLMLWAGLIAIGAAAIAQLGRKPERQVVNKDEEDY